MSKITLQGSINNLNKFMARYSEVYAPVNDELSAPVPFHDIVELLNKEGLLEEAAKEFDIEVIYADCSI